MRPIPPYSFEKPWHMERCQIRIGDFLYDVVSTVIVPNYRRWYAVRDGRPITKMRAKFTTLLRDLGDLAAAEEAAYEEMSAVSGEVDHGQFAPRSAAERASIEEAAKKIRAQAEALGLFFGGAKDAGTSL